MNFEPGQIVSLKSGGPPLTVIGSENGDVRCVWFAHADDRLQEATIPSVCLDLLDDEDMSGEADEVTDAPQRLPGRGR